jgi:hypothetical protein
MRMRMAMKMGPRWLLEEERSVGGVDTGLNRRALIPKVFIFIFIF